MRKTIFLLSFLLTCCQLKAQLLDIEWKKNIFDKVNFIIETTTDKEGNIYILTDGSEGRFFNKYLSGDTPRKYALIKINSSQEMIWIKALGGERNLVDYGTLTIDNSGNVIVGGSVLDYTFYYDSKKIVLPFNTKA